MTRIELGTGIGATSLNPISFAYERVGKDGSIPVISYLIGSHFNERIDGVVTASSTGTIENDTLTFSGGKLEIAGDDDATEARSTKVATHSTFMYFWPKSRIHGNSEIPVIQVPEISASVKHTLRMRTAFTDLDNGDALYVDLDAGNDGAGSGPATQPQLTFKEKRGSLVTTLASFDLPGDTAKPDRVHG